MNDIIGYEGLYAVTSCGKVWSHRRQKFLAPKIDRYGYVLYHLYKDGKEKLALAHRLVAQAYIPNPENKPDVNHLDEDKQNNSVNNLAWCTTRENCNYGNRNAKLAMKSSIPVYCIEQQKVYPSALVAAQETGATNGGISCCCRGKQKTSGGYHWRYATAQEAVL